LKIFNIYRWNMTVTVYGSLEKKSKWHYNENKFWIYNPNWRHLKKISNYMQIFEMTYMQYQLKYLYNNEMECIDGNLNGNNMMCNTFERNLMCYHYSRGSDVILYVGGYLLQISNPSFNFAHTLTHSSFPSPSLFSTSN